MKFFSPRSLKRNIIESNAFVGLIFIKVSEGILFDAINLCQVSESSPELWGAYTYSNMFLNCLVSFSDRFFVFAEHF